MNVADYWDRRARRFAQVDQHRASGIIDLSPAAHWIWECTQRTAVARHLGGWRGKNVIDIGCGSGRWLEYLARSAQNVVGLDVAPGMRALAESRSAHLGNVQVIGDWDRLEPETFDSAISLNVLHAIDDPETLRKLLHQAHRVLKPQGRWAVIVYAGAKSDGFVHGRSLEAWETLFGDAGWTLENHGAAEYNLPVILYRAMVGAVLPKKDEKNYTRSLDVFESTPGALMRLHEIALLVLSMMGFPLEWLVVGRGFVPPGADVVVLSLSKQ